MEVETLSTVVAMLLVGFHLVFFTTLTFCMRVVGYWPRLSFSYAFTTSHTFRSATAVAVRASISNPVFSFAETVEVTSIPDGER